MPLFQSSRVVENQIDEFFDKVGEGALVFDEGVRAYMQDRREEFDHAIGRIDRLESEADKLRRDIEAYLYGHSLIPEHRGDVLGLLENTDNIIDTAKASLYQFSVEHPDIPEQYRPMYVELAESCCKCVEALLVGARAFFRDVGAVKDSLYKVHHYERQADELSDRLKRDVFDTDLELARKIHLRYFALNVERVSDRAEEVADRLAIYAIKRSL